MVDERFPNWLIDIEKGTIYSLKHKKYIGTIDKKDNYVKVRAPKGYKHLYIHQYIWMCANGCDIPEGYHIHHIDHNQLNNSIYNLELIEKTEHHKLHGKNISEETKRKISKSLSGVYNNPKKSKQVAQYTLDGELVKIWCSANECGRNGFNCGHVCACCRGEQKTYKGFKWKYINE